MVRAGNSGSFFSAVNKSCENDIDCGHDASLCKLWRRPQVAPPLFTVAILVSTEINRSILSRWILSRAFCRSWCSCTTSRGCLSCPRHMWTITERRWARSLKRVHKFAVSSALIARFFLTHVHVESTTERIGLQMCVMSEVWTGASTSTLSYSWWPKEILCNYNCFDAMSVSFVDFFS